jgi:transposase
LHGLSIEVWQTIIKKEVIMPAAYSKDLRERVIQQLRNGALQREVAEYFQLGISTVQRWWVIWLEEERLCGKTGYQKSHSAKITDDAKFKEFIRANPNKNQIELGLLWDDPCSDSTIGKALKRINYTYKKRH